MTNEPPMLLGVSAEAYGAGYNDGLLAQYSLYVEMADRISQRRQTANAFFLSINTLLVALMSISLPDSVMRLELLWPLAIGVAGLVLSISWYAMVTSYRRLNSAKFQVVHEIEALLPIRPYTTEWDAVGYGRNRHLYLPVSHIESVVPWVFATLFLSLALAEILAVVFGR